MSATTEMRKERIPLGRFRRKLEVSGGKIPDSKVGRWLNDTPGRLQDALQGGYQFVSNPTAKVGEGATNERDPNSQYISRVVGKDASGAPLKAYLMLIDKDLYEQDQKEKLKQVDEIEKSYKRGNDQFGKVGIDGRFVPQEGIRFSTT